MSPLYHDFVDFSKQQITRSRSNCPSRKEHWLLLCNAQSLFFKLDELRALVEATNPSLLCVTESWLTPNIDNDIVQINGYCSFRNDRGDNPLDVRKGGGTIVYASTSVSPHAVDVSLILIDSPKPNGIEYNLIAFYDPFFVIYVVHLYPSWPSNSGSP